MKPTHTLREEHDKLMRKIRNFEEVLDALSSLSSRFSADRRAL